MSNILGIGTDIVYLPRIARLIAKNRVVTNSGTLRKITNKFMHQSEQQKFLTLLEKSANEPNYNDKLINYTAGIWASKESLLKAISSFVPEADLIPAQTIYSKLYYKINTDSGLPIMKIDKEFPNKYPEHKQFYDKYISNSEYLLSMSHDHDYLVSYCCILKKSD